MCVCVCVYINTHAHTHTHTRAHTHIHHHTGGHGPGQQLVYLPTYLLPTYLPSYFPAVLFASRESQAERLRTTQAVMDQGSNLLGGLSDEELSSALAVACAAKDAGGAGRLPRAELLDAIRSTLESLGLNPKAALALLASADFDDAGEADYQPLVSYAPTLLKAYARQVA